jgi:hypothetical protein
MDSAQRPAVFANGQLRAGAPLRLRSQPSLRFLGAAPAQLLTSHLQILEPGQVPPPIHLHEYGVGKHGQDHQLPLSGVPIADQATSMLSVEGTEGQLLPPPLEQLRERDHSRRFQLAGSRANL